MAKYTKFSDEQIALVNNINLVDYLRDNGEVLVKSGKEFRWQRYTSVTVRGNKWYKHKTQEGGFPIKFLQEFYGYSFRESMELLLSYANDTGVSIDSKNEEQKEIKEFALPVANSNNKRVYEYLIKKRYLNKDVVDTFVNDGLIYEDKKYHNVVFVGVDEEGIARHAHKKATYTINNRSYRGNVEGSDPYYSFRYHGIGNRLYVFEAPIDMLSYISLHKKDWKQNSYLALCGLGMKPLEKMLEQNPKLDLILLGMDHDVAGSEGSERMDDYLLEKGYEHVGVVVPKNKDFNEDLKEKHGVKDIQKGITNPNYAMSTNLINVLESKESKIQEITIDDLSKAFTDMYYDFYRSKKINYQKLNVDMQKVLQDTLYLAEKNIVENRLYDNPRIIYHRLQDDYRSYKDKGNLKKKIEEVKEVFQEIRSALKQTNKIEELDDAYRKFANASFLVLTGTHRELEKIQKEVVHMKNKPAAAIIGADGNIFNLMGIASKALKDNDMKTEAKEMVDRITDSKSYQEALSIMMEYVEPVDVQEVGEYDFEQTME